MIFQKETIVNICQQIIQPKWLDSVQSYPNFLNAVPIAIKNKNEAFLDNCSQELSDHFQKLNHIKVKLSAKFRQKWGQELEQKFDRIIREETILDISAFFSENDLNSASKEIKTFLAKAKEFDPKLTTSDLGQAIRNYLVYGMFIELAGKKQQFTSAIFGYSMLYPVTDNFIDDPHNSDREKQAYNQLIHDKIAGKSVSPQTLHEQQTCRLLSYIEEFYPRSGNPDIYNGLALMLDAQQESLHQHKTQRRLTMAECLHISSYKGSISVLIDGFFANEHMSEEDFVFYLTFGFVLQLTDDLQDITSDLDNKHQTLFTLKQSEAHLETMVNRLLHFTFQLFHEYQAQNGKFQDFLWRGSLFLILMSVNISKEHFSPDYLQKLELSFPVSFAYLDNYIKESALYPGKMPEDKLMQVLELYLSTT